MAKKHQHVYAFEIKMGQSVAESQQQKHSTKARDIHMTYRITCTRNQQRNWLCNPNCWAGSRDGIRTMLRIGLFMTLHPSKGRARALWGAPIDVQKTKKLRAARRSRALQAL